MRAIDVITVVEAAVARYGVPGQLRSDNGPEFGALVVDDQAFSFEDIVLA